MQPNRIRKIYKYIIHIYFISSLDNFRYLSRNTTLLIDSAESYVNIINVEQQLSNIYSDYVSYIETLYF